MLAVHSIVGIIKISMASKTYNLETFLVIEGAIPKLFIMLYVAIH